MTRGIWEFETLRDDGTGDAVVVTGATVTVKKESDGTLASIYDAVTGGSALANPFNPTGSTILFYADQEERYRITIETATETRDLRHQSVSIDLTDYEPAFAKSGDAWAQVGSGLSVASLNAPAVAALDSETLAFIDLSTDELRTYQWDGSAWAQTGNGLSVAVGYIGLTALNSTDIALVDDSNDTLRTYRWDGTDWAQIGNSLAITGVNRPSLAGLNTTDVAFIGDNSYALRTYRWDGTDWAAVGAAYTFTDYDSPVITALSSTDIAFVDNLDGALRVYRWDGSNWAAVGNSTTVTGASYPTITGLNASDVGYFDLGNDALRLYRWDGADWSQVGDSLTITGSGFWVALAALDSNDVAVIDSGYDELRTYHWSASAFNSTFGTTAGTVCEGNDPRLSDDRAPTDHAASHAAGGADELTPAAIGAQEYSKRTVAAVDPTATDDDTLGYSAWSVWANSATSEVFRCIDATTGAAVWVKTSLTIDELGGAALLEVGTAAGTVAAGDDSRFLTASNKTDLTDAGDSALHYHATDRARANHTGTQPLSTISDAGTAAAENVGTATGDVVQLEDVGGVPGLPSVDGSQLTGVGASFGATSITLTVGTGGDHTTINAALEEASQYLPLYKAAGVTVTINLLTGFTMAEQVLVHGLDLGWVTITAADANVSYDSTALTTSIDSGMYGTKIPAFGVSRGGVLPRIDAKFTFTTASANSTKMGVLAVGGSAAEVTANGGFVDCPGYAVAAMFGSSIMADSVDVSGAGFFGIMAGGASNVRAINAVSTGAGFYGAFSGGASFVDVNGADGSTAGSAGFYVEKGGILNAGGATGTLSQTANTITADGIIFQ